MTQANTIAAVLHSAIAFGSLWALVFFFWRSYRIDRIRDRLFQIRYELFSMAEKKEIRFDHPAYYLLRGQINRMLARAHRITGMRLLISAPSQISDPRETWKESLLTLRPDVKERLEALESRMAKDIFWQVVTGSPLSFAVAIYRILCIAFDSHDDDPHQFFVDAVSRDAYEVPLEKQEATLALVG